MPNDTKTFFVREMVSASGCYERGDFLAAQHHLERAHILGQLHFWRHLRSHWWMLKVAVRLAAPRAVAGQIFRMAAVVPGYVFGWVPLGNTGGTDVSPILPMALPPDLAPFFDGYRPARTVALRLLLVAIVGFAMTLLLAERARAADADPFVELLMPRAATTYR